MHRTIKLWKTRAERQEQWNRYAPTRPPLHKDLFGRTFRVRNDQYRIEGCLPNSPIYTVYAVRKRDGFTFAVRPDEIPEAVIRRKKRQT